MTQPDEGADATAVVTGGASGIGLALARGLTHRGFRVAIIDKNEERLAAAHEELPSALPMLVDVRDAAAVDEAAARCKASLGLPTVVCANAGISSPGGRRLWEMPDEEWAAQFSTNFYGVHHTIRSFFPLLLEAGGGRLLITASMAGLTPSVDQTSYVASKHAVLSLAETLHLQMARWELPVSVSVLCPSRVTTNITETHDDEFEFPESAVAAGVLTPDEAAAQTLDDMEAGRFYVFTHSHAKQRVDEWYADISEAFTHARY